MVEQVAVPTRADYGRFYSITSRWMDNDSFGHINNVTYYSYFDTAVNQFMVEQAGFDIKNSPVLAYVVHSNCTYRSSLAHPAIIEVGLRIHKLGTSSVRYGIGVFKQGNAEASAHGEFVHVFVHPETERAVPIPDFIRSPLLELQARCPVSELLSQGNHNS